MADQDSPAVGSVAEEAARLLEALGGWAGRAGYADDTRGHEPAGADEASASSSDPSSATPRCTHCGAENGIGQAVVCQLCPICQGLSLLRSVRPETVDRLADVAGTLAAALRDIAAQRRGAGERPSASGPAQPGTRVQDIAIDEDQGSAAP